MGATPELARLNTRIAKHAKMRAEAIREACLTDRSLRWEFDPLTATAFELMDASPVAGAEVAGLVQGGLWRLARNREAGRLLERAIEIEEKHFDADHPTLAVRYSNLALVLGDLGGADNLQEARRRLQDALRILLIHFPETHPHVGVVKGNLMAVGRSLGDLGPV